jgi:tetratricopeptide (TPR) repeat protein
MDSREKIAKHKILPPQKSKVFGTNANNSEESSIWVPSSFEIKKRESQPGHGHSYKSHKASFIPRNPPSEDSHQPLETLEEPNHSRADLPGRYAQPEKMHQRKRLAFTLLAVAGVLVVIGATSWVSYQQGVTYTINRLAELQKELPAPIPAELEKNINSALNSYAYGNATEATSELEVLYKRNQTIPSTSFLLALTALQSGNLKLAQQMVDESLSKAEKVSDSLALKAAIEMELAGRGGMGDPKVRAESLLRSAMAADISNPRPYIELGSLLRFQGRNDEARKLFEGAKVRLNPVEGHPLVNTSLALLNLQQMSNSQLPTDLNPDKDTVSLISAAYVAMRKNDIPALKALLAKARDRLSTPLYEYLINDPAIKIFIRNPELSKCF